MKIIPMTLVISAAMIIAACSASKKSTKPAAAPTPASTSATGTSTASSAPASTTAVTAPASFLVAKSSNGIYAPGNDELLAIQSQYGDATMEQLKEGHFIYTEGACVKCHGAMNIYRRGEARWKEIIDDMAQRARLPDSQKDAVYKYVLAIKAMQPK
jgi:hypothetical protein